MDLRQLSYFVAVAQEGHLGRAAERLSLSQPPLTRQIQLLEEELGVKLFTRTAKGMLLTQAGEGLLDDALKLRGMAEVAAEKARRAGLGQVGRIEIGVYGSSIFGVIPRVLAAFRTTHPDVQLGLHHAPALELATALRQGRVLAVFERWLPDDPDIRSELVAQERLLLAVKADHPLASHDVVEVGALRDQLLIIGMAPTMATQAIVLCRSHGFEPRFAPPASDITMTALMAAAGLGVAVVPESMGNVHLPGVAYRPLQTRTVMDLYCYHLRGEASPLLGVLLETVRTFRGASRPGPAPEVLRQPA